MGKINRKPNASGGKLFSDTGMYTLAKSDKSQIIQVDNHTGEGTMSYYSVFPGVFLLFNDFHMNQCKSEFQTQAEIMCIDHCREGRIQQEISNGAYIYLGAGDFLIDNRKGSGVQVEFPSGYYHGLTIWFLIEEANQGIGSFIKEFPVDICELQKKYCSGRSNLVLQNDPGLERIFQDLYSVPMEIRIPYFRVKLQELLLYLEALEVCDKYAQRPYFYKTQIEKCKGIHKLMTDNLECHFTLEELSERFDFPMTSMKECFKGIYGDTIFSYMRSYRMNRAAVLLRHNKDKSVLEIASFMGYDSPGKFSSAFKAIMGISPLAYRKNNTADWIKHTIEE